MAALAAAAAPAPPVILGAQLRISSDGNAASAELRLRLSRAPQSLELQAVEHRGAAIERLSAELDGLAAGVEALESAPPARAWRVLAAAATPGDSELVLRYRVGAALSRAGDRASLLVPVVLPRLRGGAPRPDLFRAELPLPPGHEAWETFPSVPPLRSGAAGLGLELPVLPGFVRVDSGPGAVPLLAPARLADAATLAALGGLAALGAAALRRELRRRDA